MGVRIVPFSLSTHARRWVAVRRSNGDVMCPDCTDVMQPSLLDRHMVAAHTPLDCQCGDDRDVDVNGECRRCRRPYISAERAAFLRTLPLPAHLADR